MKKKWLAFLLAAAVAAVSLAGCGGVEDDGTFDERYRDVYYSVQTYGLDEAVLVVTSTDESSETVVEETGSYGWIGTPGMTIGQMMEEWGMESIEPSCEGYDFLGWIARETVVEVDENGFENSVEKDLFEGKLFTTEEMLSQELGDNDVCFYTVWDLVCDECEEHKVCTVYYIDDARYFVCDDCYEEFAAGMGLV